MNLTPTGAISQPAAPKAPAPAPAPTPYSTQLNDFLAAERQSESGGNYTAYNAAGGAAGAYQFIQPTWNTWAAKVAPQYVGVNPAMAPQSVQDQVAAAMAGSYYQSSGDNWKTVAEDWYYPAWAGIAADQNRVPYPSAGNTLTIGQYGDKVVNAMNQLLQGQNQPAPSPGQQGLNSLGQSALGPAGAQGAVNNVAAGIATGSTQAQYQLSQQELLQNLNNTLAQLGISGSQLAVQQRGIGETNAYEASNYAQQQKDLAQALQNLNAQYGFTQQQFGLQGTEIGQEFQNAMQNADSSMAGSGLLNSGTRAVEERPIIEQQQNALANLGIQQGQAAQSHTYSQQQLADQKAQEALQYNYQHQQLKDQLQQLGYSQQGLALQGSEAQQAYNQGYQQNLIGLGNQIASMMQNYNIMPTLSGQAGQLLSSLMSVGYSPSGG